MPVILSNDQERVWLDNDMADVSDLLSTLKTYPAEEMNYKSGIGPHNGNCQERPLQNRIFQQ
jgi:putative SOS response-associated peptidase YedK